MLLQYVGHDVLISLPFFLSFSVVPEILLLVEQVCSRTTQVDDLRTPITILLQSRALEAVESV